MSIFGTIMDKIFHRASAAPAETPAAPASAAPTGDTAPASQAGGGAPAQIVDVGAVLSQMASQKGGGGNYQTSIVDLLKLLDLDSSLAARTALAEELNVRAGEHGSPEQNIALQKAVMRQLEANGGKVPASLKD